MPGFIIDQTRNPAITASPVAHMSAAARVPAIKIGLAEARGKTRDEVRDVPAEAILIAEDFLLGIESSPATAWRTIQRTGDYV